MWSALSASMRIVRTVTASVAHAVLGAPPVILRTASLPTMSRLERRLAMRNTALQILLLLTLAWSQASHAADASAPIMLVASPELQDQLFGAAVLVVTPLSDGAHAGFIVNHPTQITL